MTLKKSASRKFTFNLISILLVLIGFFSFFYFRYTNIIIIVFGTLGVGLLIYRTFKDRNFDYVNGLFVLSLLGFTWSLLSYFWVVNIADWQYANQFMYMGLCFVILFNYCVNNDNLIRVLLNLFFLIILIHNLIGVYEIITGNYIFFDNLNAIEEYRNSHFPVTFFYNTNNFALFQLFAVIFLLSVDENNFYFLSDKWAKIIKYILLSVSLVLIYFTQSRFKSSP